MASRATRLNPGPLDGGGSKAVSATVSEATTARGMWIAFATGSILPFVAVFLKPENYSFYMFFPADPPTLAARIRLTSANVLLASACAVAAMAALWLLAVGLRSRRVHYFLPAIVVFLNPLLQPVFLERFDTYMNYRWWHRASAASLVGKSEEEVRRVLGAPSVVSSFEDGIEWDYKPLPFYWVGSKGQVFFWNARVSSLEPNDD